MVKIFTRTKRKESNSGGRNRKNRPKTFKSEESAKKWAESHGIKKYRLEDLKPNSEQNSKIRVIVEE